jgi:hypothetical protein
MPGVILVMVIIISMVGIGVAEEMSRLPADITVIDAECDRDGPDANVTGLTLRVDYHGDSALRVHSHTWDAKRHVQHPWEPRTVRLEPGAQTVTIQAPRPRAGITPGERAQVYLNHGQKRAIENWEVQRCAGA